MNSRIQVLLAAGQTLAGSDSAGDLMLVGAVGRNGSPDLTLHTGGCSVRDGCVTAVDSGLLGGYRRLLMLELQGRSTRPHPQ